MRMLRAERHLRRILFRPLLLVIFVVSFLSVVAMLSIRNTLASSLTAPVQLTPNNEAVINGTSQYTQAWTSVPTAVKYEYQSFYDANGTSLRWSGVTTIPQKSTSKVAEAVYWWRVRAIDQNGDKGAWSPLRKLAIDNTAPVASLAATSPGAQAGFYNASVTVTATVASQEQNLATHQFVITNPSGSTTAIAPVSATSNTYIFPLDTSFGEGVYKISYTAIDKAGNRGDASMTLTVDTAPPALPPQLLGDAVRSMRPGTVTRSWGKSPSSDVSSYLYKSFKSYNDALHNPETSNINFSATYPTGQDKYNLVGETGITERTFYYRVAAVDKAGNKTWSNEVYSVTVDSTPSPAPTLQLVSLANGILTNNNVVSALWNKPSEDTVNYKLRYSKAPSSGQSAQAVPTAVSVTTEQWNGVLGEESGEYTLQVQAIDRAGNESPWSEAFVVNLDTTAPSAPTLTVRNDKGELAANAAIKTPAVTGTWNKSADDVIKYTFEYWNDVAGSVSQSSPKSFEVTDATWTGQLEGGNGTYSLRVRATDAVGNVSPWSGVVLIVLDTTEPTPVVTPVNPVTPASPVTPAPANTMPATPTVRTETPASDPVQNITPSSSNNAPAVDPGSIKPHSTGATNVDGGETNDSQEIKGVSDAKLFDWSFGIPWWAWLTVVVILSGGWWIVAGVRRRNKQ